MKYFMIVLMMLVVMMSVMPAFAQDGTGVAISQYDPPQTNSELVFIGMLFIMLVFLAVLGYQIKLAYNSAPEWIKPLIQMTLEQGMAKAENAVNKTDNPIDNEMLTEVREMFIELKLLAAPSQKTVDVGVATGTLLIDVKHGDSDQFTEE